MPRNFNCNCLCHGSDGNVHDPYFSCKNCYAANHMGNLPRQSWEDVPKSKSKKPKAGGKPRLPRLEVKEGFKKDDTLTLPKRPAVEVRDGKPVSTQSSN